MVLALIADCAARAPRAEHEEESRKNAMDGRRPARTAHRVHDRRAATRHSSLMKRPLSEADSRKAPPDLTTHRESSDCTSFGTLIAPLLQCIDRMTLTTRTARRHSARTAHQTPPAPLPPLRHTPHARRLRRHHHNNRHAPRAKTEISSGSGQLEDAVREAACGSPGVKVVTG